MVQEKNEEERELEKKLEKYFLPFLHERLWLKFVRGWELFMDCPVPVACADFQPVFDCIEQMGWEENLLCLKMILHFS